MKPLKGVMEAAVNVLPSMPTPRFAVTSWFVFRQVKSPAAQLVKVPNFVLEFAPKVTVCPVLLSAIVT